ncbi:hypothetical protein GCM10018793_00540 [Streptomyces sulfonofaciens]|uniref:Uncharacterized protein n=1 Tax=Streptomyces sulfonofaciens TaxID=68272 RepID=A0A919FML3_9ACTN|nr:hypothetical protein GCM10018793_00540 [Streptomyces sulfonofaciens]
MAQRAYAWASAGMPGLLVALVFCGAHVMTVTGPPGFPPPGSTPQAALSAAQSARQSPARSVDLP